MTFLTRLSIDENKCIENWKRGGKIEKNLLFHPRSVISKEFSRLIPLISFGIDELLVMCFGQRFIEISFIKEKVFLNLNLTHCSYIKENTAIPRELLTRIMKFHKAQ